MARLRDLQRAQSEQQEMREEAAMARAPANPDVDREWDVEDELSD